MQEDYIRHVCKQRDCPELWCPRLSVDQAKTVQNICCAMRSRYRVQPQNIQTMGPLELSTFQENEMLVKRSFLRTSLVAAN